jgi:hypothetical protein
MHEISDSVSLIFCVGIRYAIRLFDDILVNDSGFCYDYVFNSGCIDFRNVWKAEFEADVFDNIFINLSDCFIDDLNDSFWF